VPIYEYRCDDCGALIEAFQKMSDDPLTECEQCGGPLRKVLHPVAIHFKGSGFYTTDYGKGSGRRAAGKDAGADASSDAGGSSSGDGASGSDAKPSGGKDTPSGEGKPKEKQKAT
jgi:putative FmdB family regulatory protein